MAASTDCRRRTQAILAALLLAVVLGFLPGLADMPIQAPRARTAEGWLTFGLDEDLDAALDMALVGMLDLMQEQHGLGRADALALASVVVDMRVTQVVNGVRGVHAVLPYGALK